MKNNKAFFNKGFSLVELIIVIAIIAIISISIAPTIIRYIDKSRKADDVAAADSIETAFKACMSTEEIYEAVMKVDSITKSNTANSSTILLVSKNGDTEWSYFGTSSVDLSELKKVMDETCQPPEIKFTKSVSPTDSSKSNLSYLLSSFNDFVPGGWAIGINPDGEICIYVTNGKSGAAMQGVAINPPTCPAYK
ncbi:MAG: prepilin-type N-terminal cleavage/methylation domain-containing protein [Eubacterium sp.]|nr:prepilin-type N-terminal cleavage/methylation domain-containing protein [Eubacterium sp.]